MEGWQPKALPAEDGCVYGVMMLDLLVELSCYFSFAIGPVA